MTVDVLIPAYRPDRKFLQLLRALNKQTVLPRRIIVMNTERAYWEEELYRGISHLEVHHLSRQEFDHGATRNEAAFYSDAEVMVFMTDDAVPKDSCLLENLLAAFSRKGPNGETIAMAYARQLPAKDCRVIERYTRRFNYPEEESVKTAADLPQLGIKTYFASNVCCAYRKDIFEKQGGFVDDTIFNEDMIYAAGVIQAGYAIAYVPEARVVHSHNLSARQQFRRNFDLAVSQADHPEVFDGLPSENEGIRLVKQTAKYLVRSGHILLLPSLVFGSGAKYLGYRMGKRYRSLPRQVIRRCSMSPVYWEKKWRSRT